MHYRFYTTSQKAWDAILKNLAKAQESIYLEMYIFLGDTSQSHNFLGVLEERARAGVKVALVLDAYGSRELKRENAEALRQAGVELLFFSQWIRRTHRKLVIIDRKLAFLGGVNIEEKTRLWQDLQVKLSGRIVTPLVHSFAYAYQRAGGKDKKILACSRRPLRKKLKSWALYNFGFGEKRYRLNNYYQRKISEAQESIKIVTPYLLPPRWLMASLDEAIHRGVKVEIVIPEHTDIKSLDQINYINACRLHDIGVEFFFLPSMNHAKAMLIDGNEAVVGSQNLDILSFNFNSELGVFFQQKEAVSSLAKIINRWQAQSHRPHLDLTHLNWRKKVMILLLRLFFPIF